MKHRHLFSLSMSMLSILIACVALLQSGCRSDSSTAPTAPSETRAQYDARMQWWSDARFGLIIHWGLYSIPAGEWNGGVYWVEHIRNKAEIPLAEYHKLLQQFNPVRYEARQWVQYAKASGAKYLIFTTKHHDGFCLFDSKYTEFDMMSTAYQKDVLTELALACKEGGIRLGLYYSILDWDHADYLPKLPWETDRQGGNADYSRYAAYVKNQITELLTNYPDISILWLDGEWEPTWLKAYGFDLYKYARSLRPDLIINDRIKSPREGIFGFSEGSDPRGDFATMEKDIPEEVDANLYWESCEPMNAEWGYTRRLNFWQPVKDMIRHMTLIASRGGNYLLGIGPADDGSLQQQITDRLTEIGQWMQANGESIYGTRASTNAKPSWGCLTERRVNGKTRMYLHVFDWPSNGILTLHGVHNTPTACSILTDAQHTQLPVTRDADAIQITVPSAMPDDRNTVIAIDFAAEADVVPPPRISSDQPIFIDRMSISITDTRKDVNIRYTLDGTVPTFNSPLVQGSVMLTGTSVVVARCFIGGTPVSDTTTRTYMKIPPREALHPTNLQQGLRYAYYLGTWDDVPDFSTLTPERTGIAQAFELIYPIAKINFGFEYKGYISIPRDDAYTFVARSDDGSYLYVDDTLVVNNGGPHVMISKQGTITLRAGYHSIRLTYFQRAGDVGLSAMINGGSDTRVDIPPSSLFHEE
jgi:alpha-L-fucosidase